MTILEIAKKANVSKSTVSRYLNNQSVSEKTKAILKKIIEEENFKPSESARKLRGIRNEVGIIIQRINSTTVSQYLDGVVSTCLKFGLTPIILPTNFDTNKLDEFVNYGIKSKYLAIIIMSHIENLHYSTEKTKIIIVGQKSNYHTSFVFQSKKYVYNLVKTTCNKRKIKRIIFVTVDIDDKEFSRRKDGCKKAALELGIDFIELRLNSFKKFQLTLNLLKGDYYVCATDEIALNIYRKILKSSFNIGIDIFLSGYGGYPISEDFELTTIYNDYYKLGEDVILKLYDKNISEIKIESKIIYRKTT